MLGDRIKNLRNKKGVTQDTMAKVLGVSPQAISKWEQNSTMPDVSMLVPMADYFGVSVDYLFREPSKAVVENPEQYVEIACEKVRNAWRCVVKNVSDTDFDRVKLKTYFYDKDGNSIDYRETLVFDLASGTVKSELLFSPVGASATEIKVVVKSIDFA